MRAHGFHRGSLFMLCLLASSLSVEAARASEEGHRRLVEGALRCRPTAAHACATREDELAAVEDAHPMVAVVAVVPHDEGIQATVLRYPDLPENGVFFEYVFGAGGRLESRQCIPTLPGAGAKLQQTHKAAGVDGDRLVFVDRCSVRGACRNETRRRLSFRLSRDGTLSEPVEMGGTSDAVDGDPVDCLFIPQDVPLPAGPAVLTSLRGWGYVRDEAGHLRALERGIDVAGRTVLLGFQSSVTLDVGSIPLSFVADGDKGLQLRLGEDPALKRRWRAMQAIVQRAERRSWYWSPPFLTDARDVYRLAGRGAKLECSSISLDESCRRGCADLRRSAGPVVGDGLAFLPGPGAILSGKCERPR